jgi:hypothetical protein
LDRRHLLALSELTVIATAHAAAPALLALLEKMEIHPLALLAAAVEAVVVPAEVPAAAVAEAPLDLSEALGLAQLAASRALTSPTLSSSQCWASKPNFAHINLSHDVDRHQTKL